MKEKEKYSRALGKRIRSLRESNDISLKGFEIIEPSIDRHDLSRIETGKKIPSAYTLFKICRAIGISQDELLRGIEGELK